MKYEEMLKLYTALKNNLSSRREAIIKNNLEKINKLDEDLIVIVNQLKAIKSMDNNFSDTEKQNLKNLAEEIKKLEENNEILINHSLDVINNTLSGILNIVQKDKKSYNSKGMNCQSDTEETISSIIEEA